MRHRRRWSAAHSLVKHLLIKPAGKLQTKLEVFLIQASHPQANERKRILIFSAHVCATHLGRLIHMRPASFDDVCLTAQKLTGACEFFPFLQEPTE